MPRYFFDSSALAKAYHVETGTAKVVAILNEAGSEFFISSLSVLEMQSVFSQKVRDGRITETDYAILKRRFSSDIQSRKIIVKNLLRPHQKAAEKLLEKHAKVRPFERSMPFSLVPRASCARSSAWITLLLPTSISSKLLDSRGSRSSIQTNHNANGSPCSRGAGSADPTVGLTYLIPAVPPASRRRVPTGIGRIFGSGASGECGVGILLWPMS